jgi:hypothetical protein
MHKAQRHEVDRNWSEQQLAVILWACAEWKHVPQEGAPSLLAQLERALATPV